MRLGDFVCVGNSNQSIHLCVKSEIDRHVRIWKHNRPIDKCRFESIRDYYTRQGSTLVDGVIYAWLNDDALYIYDGWNRYNAAKSTMKMLLCVTQTKDEGAIKDHFIALNSAVPLPEMYEPDNDSKTSEIVRQTIQRFDDQYEALKKPSKRPHAPHFNRDVLTELFFNLNVPWDEMTPESFWEVLMATNEAIGREQKVIKSEKSHQKANQHNMWLFTIKGHHLAKRIEDQISSNKQTVAEKLFGLFKK